MALHLNFFLLYRSVLLEQQAIWLIEFWSGEKFLIFIGDLQFLEKQDKSVGLVLKLFTSVFWFQGFSFSFQAWRGK